ncbi:MAG: ABC transporter permease [Clostridiales bacterium]|nr:ABC transporter permease [Clostridiales bacterium]
MREATAIFRKQILDTRKNRAVLIQFIMFPIMTIVMSNAIKVDDMPEFFYLKLFSIMYMAMAPIVSMSAIISEEKEKGTLRALMMSNVSPMSYLLGVGVYDFLCCLIGTMLMSKSCGLDDGPWWNYMCVIMSGLLISIVLGAAIGVLAKDQMAATSLAVPVMCIFTFLPMMAQFNDTIAKVAKFIYTQQLYLALNDINNVKIVTEGLIIIVVNALLVLGFFIIAFRKEGLTAE